MIKNIIKTPLLLASALWDLVIQVTPLQPASQFKFAFIVHPRTEADAARRYAFARLMPKTAVSFWTREFWPIILSRVSGVRDLKTGRAVPGLIVLCPLTAKQLTEDRDLAKKRILQTIYLAEKYGVEVIGLGGLTASVTRGGLDLTDQARAGLVTGRALTPWIVSQYALDGSRIAGWELEKITVAIVGAAGGIGFTSAKILAKLGVRHFILIDLYRKKDRLEELLRQLHDIKPSLDGVISDEVSAVKEANVIITATSAPEALITSEMVSPQTIIVDDAQPSDLAPEVFERDDIVVAAGGIIKIPGVHGHLHLSFSEREENFSCFGEVVAMAAHNLTGDFSIGYPTDEEVSQIAVLSKEIGITRGNFQNHRRSYIDKEIKNITRAAKF